MQTPTDHEIDLDTRLELLRRQVRMRLFERRAYDLFMERPVKGTSHLSLGQEAIAADAPTSCWWTEAYADVAE